MIGTSSETAANRLDALEDDRRSDDDQSDSGHPLDVEGVSIVAAIVGLVASGEAEDEGDDDGEDAGSGLGPGCRGRAPGRSKSRRGWVTL